MARWRSLNRQCPGCNRFYDGILFDLDTEKPDEHVCSACGTVTESRMHAPMVMTRAYPDGVRTDLNGMKERANLECEKHEYREGTPERNKIEQEISKIT